MRETSTTSECFEPCADGTYELGILVKSALDQERACLPRGEVSEQDTRYPTDATSMRAFLEVFFTRHLFQLQNSLTDYITSSDFNEAIQSGSFRILDIGSGPAVASQALVDAVDRMIGDAGSDLSKPYALLRATHVLNDTSAICLATGKRMLTTCSRNRDQSRSAVSRPQIFTLSAAFPGNLHQIYRLASFLGGVDLVILSYVLHPLIEDVNLQSLAGGVKILERLCKPHGRLLIVQDKFQEPLIRKLAGMMDVEYREQTLTQKIYPPRGSNETCTYTYYDCLYTPRGSARTTETCTANITR